MFSSTVKFAEPRVHAMVYEPTTGMVKKLPVDFKKYLKDLRSVYNLYNVEDYAANKTVAIK